MNKLDSDKDVNIIFRRLFFKSAIFNCSQFQKSEHHLDYDYICTVYLNSTPNRFCFMSEPHELVWRSVWSILHRNFVSKFHIIFEIFKFWNHIFRFFRFQPKKIGFGARWRFWLFSRSKKSSIYLQFCKFYINSGRCSTTVFPMNLPVNMALALFQKQFKKIDLIVTGVSGKSGFF